MQLSEFLGVKLGKAIENDQCELAIAVSAAIGNGATMLSAFDDALWQCGSGNHNHIPLSSVIPPHSVVHLADRYDAEDSEFGHRLYAVEADIRSADPGDRIAAGLGWFQWGDGRGVFVEGHCRGRDRSCSSLEAALAADLTASLRDLAARRGIPFIADQARLRIVSTEVGAQPACALVVAAYGAEGWHAQARPRSDRR